MPTLTRICFGSASGGPHLLGARSCAPTTAIKDPEAQSPAGWSFCGCFCQAEPWDWRRQQLDLEVEQQPRAVEAGHGVRPRRQFAFAPACWGSLWVELGLNLFLQDLQGTPSSSRRIPIDCYLIHMGTQRQTEVTCQVVWDPVDINLCLALVQAPLSDPACSLLAPPVPLCFRQLTFPVVGISSSQLRLLAQRDWGEDGRG